MLRIACPYCGPRDETEFRYGGDTGVTRPVETTSLAWARYLYWRRNEAGERSELWLHASGCRRWLQVIRDTRTNTVLRVSDGTPASDPESAS